LGVTGWNSSQNARKWLAKKNIGRGKGRPNLGRKLPKVAGKGTEQFLN